MGHFGKRPIQFAWMGLDTALAHSAGNLFDFVGGRMALFIPVAQIADEARLELPTVSKLLKSLGHAGLVESFRGVNGGYRLARPAGEITLAQIVEALEGPIGMTECSLAEGQCERESQCGVRANWQHVNSVVDSALRAVSLSDMLKPPSRRIDIHPIG